MSEPIFDKKDQLEQIQSGLMDGEEIIAVYDAIGAGTGFVGMTTHRVIVQDKSLGGKRTAITSIPYSHITTVSAVSKKSLAGSFFGSGEIEIQVGSVGYEVEFRGHEKAHHVHDLILSRITA
jgi:hypothetical protein